MVSSKAPKESDNEKKNVKKLDELPDVLMENTCIHMKLVFGFMIKLKR